MFRKALGWFKRANLENPKVAEAAYAAYLFSNAEWNQQYTSGCWDYLRITGEAAHYGVILSYLHNLGNPRRILDVGCGEGLLHAMLDPSRYGWYVGIDVSSEAISRLSPKLDAKTAFVCADARILPPP